MISIDADTSTTLAPGDGGNDEIANGDAVGDGEVQEAKRREKKGRVEREITRQREVGLRFADVCMYTWGGVFCWTSSGLLLGFSLMVEGGIGLIDSFSTHAMSHFFQDLFFLSLALSSSPSSPKPPRSPFFSLTNT